MRAVKSIWFGLVIIALASATACPIARGEDIITLKGETDEQPNTEIKADVVDWTRTKLVYLSNGRTHEVAARRVASVKFAKRAEHLTAERLLDEQKFQQAIGAFDQAMQAEDRQWVIRELVAGKIRAAESLGRTDSAVGLYLQLMQSEPESRFYYLIPLAWQSRPPSGGIAAELPDWLQGPDETRALIAASWLWNADQSAAEEKLKLLRRSENPDIAHLATAQLWRGEILTVNDSQFKRWQQQLDRMPRQLRPGPAYLTGLALQRMKRGDEAAVAWMQIPILYPDRYQLCGDALLATCRHLETEGHQTEADLVRHELDTRYRLSNAATKVNQDVESFSK